jgi:PAS domain S-box-containing protein
MNSTPGSASPQPEGRRRSRRLLLLALSIWTAVVLLSGAWNAYELHGDSISSALTEARTFSRLSQSYRLWVAGVGGVYAARDQVHPNPFLAVPERDVTTTGGQELTLVNSAYMTRMVYELLGREPSPLRNRMTSLKPLNPGNAPDEFERAALLAFERGVGEASEFTTLGGQPYLRLLKPMLTEPACLKCHGAQGYRVGDVRGGLSIAIPMGDIVGNETQTRRIILLTHLALWLVVGGGIVAVSNRRERQQSVIEESVWKFQTLSESTQDWQYWVGADGRVIFMAPSCLEITGYTVEEYLADPGLISRVIHPEDREVWEQHLDDPRADQHNELEVRIVTKDGRTRWVSHQCNPIVRGGEFLGRRSRNQEITERRLAQEELRLSEARLNEAQRVAHVGSWELNHGDSRLVWSEEIYRIFEIDPAGFPASYAGFLGVIHPDDRERVNAAFTASVQNRAPYDVLHRLLLKDGRIKHVRERCETFYDAAGVPVRSLGSVQDVTELQQASEGLERQVRHLAALRAIDLAITASLDLRVTLDVVMEYVVAELQVAAVSVLVEKPHLQVLEYAGCKGFLTDAVKTSSIRVGQGFAGRVALSRELLAIPDLSRARDLPEAPSFLEREGFAAYWAAPLIVKGRVIGVIEVYQRSPFEPDHDWTEFFEALAGQTAIAIDNSHLFTQLQRSTDDLVMAYDSTIEGWSRALDFRDKETEGHSRRVTELTLAIAAGLHIKEQELVHIRRGALLHDIGKLGVPDGILLKPGKLLDEEWVIMKRHTRIAYDLLYPIEFLRPAIDIPYCHHEKWDGSGYPRGLSGEEIPFAARIFSVVDVYDALSSDRPYRPAWSKDRVLEYLQERSGTEFDPRVVKVFLEAAKNW